MVCWKVYVLVVWMVGVMAFWLVVESACYAEWMMDAKQVDVKVWTMADLSDVVTASHSVVLSGMYSAYMSDLELGTQWVEQTVV
jgi:hypothetical protein